ncbi:MAG: YfhO family protein [Clostridia bacterium]|nr:YfhO family protein [Clostridia bacterium]
MTDEKSFISDIPEQKSKFIPFHPKRWLKDIQQRLYLSPKLYLLFCFLIPFALMFGVYLARGLHPFGEGTPLVLDLNSQYAYFFEGLRNFIYGDASSLLYSFSRSLGGEFMGMYAYYLASPLSYIVALFPQDRIQEAILTILLLKTGLSGLSFGYYLHKHSRTPKKTAVLIFSVMYALSAYAVCQQSNTMWIDALIWLPLMALGIEQLILNRRYKLYTVSLTLILISNYYIGYMLCIFAVLFFFYYYFSKSQNEINPRGEKLHFVRSGARFAVFSLLSAAISAFMLIAAYYSLGFGKSDFSTPDWSLTSKFEIVDFLTKFLPGSYDTFEPSGLPFVYCGLLTVILLPVYFTSKNISSREKIVSGALLGVFFISFIVSPIDLIWHGFSTPNWLNGRYSFLLCFVLLMLAYKAFGNLRQAGEKFLLVICALIVLFIAVAEKFELKSYINSDKKLLTFGCIWFSIFFTIALLVLLCLKIRLKSKKARNCVSAVLAAIVCVEVFCNGIVCFMKINDDVLFTKYSTYQNFVGNLRPATEALKEYDDGFYRAEKIRTSDELQRYNFPFALSLKGISNSTSTLNADAIELLNLLGYNARAHISQYRGGTPVSDSLLGIKYLLANKNSNALNPVYKVVDEIDDPNYDVYSNPYALSIAYGVSDGIKDFDLSDSEEYTNVFERYNALIPAMLGDHSLAAVFEPVAGLSIKSGNCKEIKLATQARYTSPEKTEGTFNFIYTAPYTGEYYFYPSAAGIPESVNIRVCSGNRISFLERNSDHILSLGHFEEGSEIRITFYIPKDESINFYTKRSFLWYFNTDAYDAAMQRMTASPQFEIDSESTDDHLFGNISTANDRQMILTTIPYDKGWKVFVDGEQVETYETLGALMAFDVDSAGEHSLELKYMPDVYKLGAIISVIGISAFIIICAADFILKRTLFKSRTLTAYDDFWVLEDFDTTDTTDNQSSTKEK